MSSVVVIRWLKTNSEIQQAQNILYNINIKNAIHPWQFTKNNESKIRIENNKLVDKYTNIAKWIGAFINNKLIGCVRAIIASKLTHYKLEMETYKTFPKSISNIIKKKSENYKYRIELNRMALLPSYRKHNILHCIVTYICKWSLDINAIIWGTFPINFYKSTKPFWNQRFGFKTLKNTFKYESIDPTEACIVYSQIHKIKRIVNKMNKRIIYIKYNKNNILQEICFPIPSLSKL